MAEEKKKRRRMRGNCLLPVVAFILAIAAICAAVWLLLSLRKNHAAPPAATSSSAAAQLSSSEPDVSGETDASESPVSSADSAQPSSLATEGTSLDNASWFDDAVFVGDSSTQGIQTYKLLKSSTVLATNGMSARTAAKTKVKYDSDTLTLLKALKKETPKKIYLLLGFNDLELSKSADSFAQDYSSLLDQVQETCPSATIYVQSIFPVTSSYEQKDPQRTNEKIDSFNAALKKLCSSKNVRYEDVASVFKGTNGALPSSMSDDGYNIRGKYYYSWLNYLSAHK